MNPAPHDARAGQAGSTCAPSHPITLVFLLAVAGVESPFWPMAHESSSNQGRQLARFVLSSFRAPASPPTCARTLESMEAMGWRRPAGRRQTFSPYGRPAPFGTAWLLHVGLGAIDWGQASAGWGTGPEWIVCWLVVGAPPAAGAPACGCGWGCRRERLLLRRIGNLPRTVLQSGPGRSIQIQG